MIAIIPLIMDHNANSDKICKWFLTNQTKLCYSMYRFVFKGQNSHKVNTLGLAHHVVAVRRAVH